MPAHSFPMGGGFRLNLGSIQREQIDGARSTRVVAHAREGAYASGARACVAWAEDRTGQCRGAGHGSEGGGGV
eukprot:2549600-Pleurochrysis_carterae.AAC.1